MRESSNKIRLLIFANISRPPFSNNLYGLVEAFRRRAEVVVVEPWQLPGFVPTGGMKPAEIPLSAAEKAAAFGPFQGVICLGGSLYLSQAAKRFFPDAVFVGIALSDPLALPGTLPIAKSFHLFYTQDPASLPVYQSQGVKVHRLDPAVDPETFPISPRKELWDVVFVGKFTPWRNQLLLTLARELSVKIFTHRGQESRWSLPASGPLETPQSLSQGLVSARLHLEVALAESSQEGIPQTRRITNRVQFAALVGTPSLVDYYPGLEELFQPGKEVAIYSHPEDLLTGAKQLLADPSRRGEMAEAARRRVLREQTCNHRVDTVVRDLLQMLGKIRPQK